MNGFNTGLVSIEQAKELYLKNSGKKQLSRETDGGQSFDDILQKLSDEKDAVKFSKHANARLQSRNINLSNEQIDRLNEGVSRARSRSINESLIMMDNMAFIVNVKNNTVVTAMDDKTDSVFTNIDGAVIV